MHLVHQHLSCNHQGVSLGYKMMTSLSIVLGLLHATLGQGIRKDYCRTEVFNATCSESHVILMTEAIFGRMTAGRCINGEYGQLGCSTNAIQLFDEKCSGKQTCNVPVSDLFNLKACSKDLASYLEASYQCVKVPRSSTENCGYTSGYNSGGVTVDGTEGYLLFSNANNRHQPGLMKCPWNILVAPGKIINITLMRLSPKSPYCSEKLTIEEGDESIELDVCHNSGMDHKQKRWTDLYSSKTNKITMYISQMNYMSGNSQSFMLRYKAVGCPDIPVPQNGWAKRDDMNRNTLMVQCNFTLETWYLTCTDNDWVGDIGNCTVGPEVNVISHSGSPYIPHGIIFAVLIGIVLGITIGALLLFVVHCYKQKRTNERKANFVMVPQDARDKYYEESTYTTSMAPPPQDGQLKDPYPALIRDSEIYDTNTARSVPIIRNATIATSITAPSTTPAQCFAVDNHNIHIKTYPHDKSMYHSSEQQCKECVCISTNKGTKTRCDSMPLSRYMDVEQQHLSQQQQLKDKCVAF